MNDPQTRRVEHQQTDKGYVPVYTTAVVEQPWSSYSRTDHQTWATLFERQRAILEGRACREFIENQQRFHMTPDAIPRFEELNEVLAKATVPEKSVKRPRTLVTRWRTWKCTSECVLSIVNVRSAAAVAVIVVVVVAVI